MAIGFRSVKSIQFDDAWIDPESGFPLGVAAVALTLEDDEVCGGVYKDERAYVRKFTIQRLPPTLIGTTGGFVARFDRGNGEQLVVNHQKIVHFDGSGGIRDEYMFLVDESGQRRLHKIFTTCKTPVLQPGLYCDDPRQLTAFIAAQWDARGFHPTFFVRWKNKVDYFLRSLKQQHKRVLPDRTETAQICQHVLAYELPKDLLSKNNVDPIVLEENAEVFAKRYVNDYLGKTILT